MDEARQIEISQAASDIEASLSSRTTSGFANTFHGGLLPMGADVTRVLAADRRRPQTVLRAERVRMDRGQPAERMSKHRFIVPDRKRAVVPAAGEKEE